MIKALVSTQKTQGQRENDFCFTNDLELLCLGFPCDLDKGNPDGECGCGRSLVGFDSGKATTTMQVAELNLTKDELIKKYMNWLKQGGWLKSNTSEEELNIYLQDYEYILEVAAQYETGAILEFREDHFNQRA